MVYALADIGAIFLIERFGEEFANLEWSRRNAEAGRPFIEHQLEIVDFTVVLRHGNAEHLGSLQVNDQLDLGGHSGIILSRMLQRLNHSAECRKIIIVGQR